MVLSPSRSLGSLFQYLTTLSLNKFYLISNLNLPWFHISHISAGHPRQLALRGKEQGGKKKAKASPSAVRCSLPAPQPDASETNGRAEPFRPTEGRKARKMPKSLFRTGQNPSINEQLAEGTKSGRGAGGGQQGAAERRGRCAGLASPPIRSAQAACAGRRWSISPLGASPEA